MDDAKLLATVRLESAPELGEELVGRLEGIRRAPLVSVTELSDPRPAYFARVHPLPPSPERAARMAAGLRRHELAERLLADPSSRELRVHWQGIVGRIDVVSDRPTEIKSSSTIPPAERIAVDRPQYLDQLGMYCAALDRPDGRLVVIGEEGPDGPTVSVLECRFDRLDGIRARMSRSAGAFREALGARDPARLPRCGWFGRGCEYQLAGVCGCLGTEALEPEPVHELVDGVRAEEEYGRKISARFRAFSDASEEDRPARLRDLLYPRRAYFDRRAAAHGIPTRGRPEPARSSEPSLYAELLEALSVGPAGEFDRRAVEPPAPEEPLPTFRGGPLLLKTSRIRRPVATHDLIVRQPHYFTELGMRCAALGRADGWLVIGYEFAAAADDPVRTYRVHFEPIGLWRYALGTRRRQLEDALLRSDPSALPPCPEWMFENCPHAPGCGDDSAPPGPDAPPRREVGSAVGRQDKEHATSPLPDHAPGERSSSTSSSL
ncbi:MAG TPA: hypothetical protein VGV89_01730 [Thermoplasmata archaeon]|nr:hypothetical protein [Thermoplasmata archaeon]